MKRLLAALFLSVVVTPLLAVTVAAVNGPVPGLVLPFWTSASYGQESFQVVSYSVNVAEDCDPRITIGRVVAALDPIIDWHTVNVVVLTQPSMCNGYSGIGGYLTNITTDDGVIPKLGYAVYDGAPSTRTAIHEFGHALGFSHAYSWACPGIGLGGIDTCGRVEYGDPYSIMGGGGMGQIGARERDWAGWLQPLDVTVPGIFELADINTYSGLRALKIRRAVNDHLYIEYRTGIGVILHTYIHYDGYNEPWSLYVRQVLAAGGSFTDPATGARVMVNALGTTASLIVDPGTPDITPPACTSTVPALDSIQAGLVRLAVELTEANPYRVLFRLVSWSGTLIFDQNIYAAPWETLWDSTTVADQSVYTIKVAYDLAGNRAYCASPGYFSVENGQIVPPTPTPTPTPTFTNTPTPTPTPTRTPCRGKSWKCR